MAAKPVKIAFLADTKDFSSAMDKVGRSADDAAADVKSSSDKIDSALASAGESSDKLATASSQTAGGLGDLGGALALLPGPLGGVGAGMEALSPAIMGVTGAADLMNVATEKFPILSKAAAAAAKAQAIATRILGAAFRFALGPIGLVIIGLTLLVGAFILAYKKSETFKRIVDNSFRAIKAVVQKVLPPIKKIVSLVFNGIKLYFTTVFKVYKTLFTTAWAVIKTVTRSAFQGIKKLVTDPLGTIVGFVRGIPGKIKALGENFKSAGKHIMQKIVEGIRSAAGFINGIATTIGNAVKSVINGVIDRVNSALEFTIKVGPKSFSINPPDIPHLAKGGIVTGPTIALIGEAGPEAVVPLNGKYGFGGGMVSVRITAQQLSALERGRAIQLDLDTYRKAGGRSKA